MARKPIGKITIEVTPDEEIIIDSDYSPLGTMLILNEAVKGNGIKLYEDLKEGE